VFDLKALLILFPLPFPSLRRLVDSPPCLAFNKEKNRGLFSLYFLMFVEF